MTTNSNFMDSVWQMYERVKEYDLHYSNIRTSVSTFLVSVALTLGSYLLDHDQPVLAAVFPTILLMSAFLLSNCFVHLMLFCVKKASALEKLAKHMIAEGDGFIPSDANLKAFDFRTEVGHAVASAQSFKKIYWLEMGNAVILGTLVVYLLAVLLISI